MGIKYHPASRQASAFTRHLTLALSPYFCGSSRRPSAPPSPLLFVSSQPKEMPAERSKGTKRGADVPQLVWTIPVEPTKVEADGPASFSLNMSSPILSEDGPPPLVDRPDYLFFPPVGDLPSPRKPAHSRKKPEDHIPRPPNAFILFRSSFIKSQHVSTEVETNHSTLSKIIGLTWKNLPHDERLLWHAKAKEALDEHKRKFPQYAFRPNQSRHKSSAEKRKVREVEPKDHKRCAKIAELLVEGKKGQELDAAIQEFDKHHVPEVVTRFEAPLTARMYRRSSSVPAPGGADNSRRRKSRSASTQPASPVVSNASSISLPEMNTESQPAETFMSTFDPYPVTPISPSFEFNTFSFDSQASPAPSFQACDPLSQPSSPNVDLLFDTACSNNSGLSIDTSFCGFDDWNCPSPLSDVSMPGTPSFMSSAASVAYDPYSMQSFEDSLAKSFSNHFPAYSNGSDSQIIGSFEPDLTYNSCSHIHMASQDHDFSAFMASLPEYGM
ncbi:Repressor ROX1 [Termitomyces sp. T112]|nr:Repressor ROX1 [Termitomyces sp. T112]